MQERERERERRENVDVDESHTFVVPDESTTGGELLMTAPPRSFTTYELLQLRFLESIAQSLHTLAGTIDLTTETDDSGNYLNLRVHQVRTDVAR